MIMQWKVSFPAKEGPDERTAYLYLPTSYDRETERRYPVLYMFDGHNVFFDSHATYGKSWGLGEYLDRSGTQLIVAAVECSHDPNNGRLKEYAPFTVESSEFGRIEGRGAKTMGWFIDVFKADIDSRFRTLPDRGHTYIAGSSMGGLMSLYAVLRFNKVFSRAAALSPSMWANNEKLETLARTARLQPDTVVYMDMGDREFSYSADARPQFGRMTGLLLERKVLLTSRVIPGGTHCEASWEKQLPFAIGALTA